MLADRMRESISSVFKVIKFPGREIEASREIVGDLEFLIV